MMGLFHELRRRWNEALNSCSPDNYKSPQPERPNHCNSPAQTPRRGRRSGRVATFRVLYVFVIMEIGTRRIFTPTSGSWSNLVERLFAEVTERCVRRGSHTAVRVQYSPPWCK